MSRKSRSGGGDPFNIEALAHRIRLDHVCRAGNPDNPNCGNSPGYRLSELLPYHPAEKMRDRLKHGVKEYKFLVRAAQKAFRFAVAGEMSQFDPLVGENSCQIRALLTSLVFSGDLSYLFGTLSRLSAIQTELTERAERLDEFARRGLSLVDLLDDYDLELHLTYTELVLIQLYLLSAVKTEKNPKADMPFVKNECTDIRHLKKIEPVGTMFAERLVKKLRELVSLVSVCFVEQIARDMALPDSFLDSLARGAIVTHNRLHCLPCFWATTVLVRLVSQLALPIVVIARRLSPDMDYAVVDEVALTFEGSSGRYNLATEGAVNPEAPALTLLVNSCRNSESGDISSSWRNELLQHSPLEYVLAYAAAHRQYPDSSFEHLISDLDGGKYHYYRERAEEWGCSVANPSGFFLSHAFCDKVGNMPKHLVTVPENGVESGAFMNIKRYSVSQAVNALAGSLLEDDICQSNRRVV